MQLCQFRYVCACTYRAHTHTHTLPHITKGGLRGKRDKSFSPKNKSTIKRRKKRTKIYEVFTSMNYHSFSLWGPASRGEVWLHVTVAESAGLSWWIHPHHRGNPVAHVRARRERQRHKRCAQATHIAAHHRTQEALPPRPLTTTTTRTCPHRRRLFHNFRIHIWEKKNIIQKFL